MNETAISIKGLKKTFKQQTVLQDIDLDILSGTYVGLVGKNGAGKTTLIKSILDFISIDSGTINLFGLPHTDRQSRACLSFLPEKFTPPYYLTGRDFIHYMLSLHNVAYEQDRVLDIFEILDLDPSTLVKPVRQYSKGMSQKLGLAACLLGSKDMLILDEPMSGLDPKARAYLKRHLMQLKDKGTSLFFSTHLLADVDTLCDRIVILHDGRVCFTGSPAECCVHYEADDLEQAYLRCVDTA